MTAANDSRLPRPAFAPCGRKLEGDATGTSVRVTGRVVSGAGKRWEVLTGLLWLLCVVVVVGSYLSLEVAGTGADLHQIGSGRVVILLGALLFVALMVTLTGLLGHAFRRNALGKRRALRERDRARAEAARYERELTEVLQTAQQLVFRTDVQGRIRFATTHWQAIARQSPLMAPGRHLREIAHPTSCAAVDALFSPRPYSGCRVARVQLMSPGEASRSLEIAVVASYDETGTLCGFTGTGVDLTELVATHQALEEQKALVSNLLEGNPLPTSLTDSGGRFISVNSAWEAFMGRASESVLGRRDFDYMSAEEAHVHCRRHLELLHAGGSIRYEQSLSLAHAGPRNLEITKVLIDGLQGQPSRVLTIAMDVTEQTSQQVEAEVGARVASVPMNYLPQPESWLSSSLAP